MGFNDDIIQLTGGKGFKGIGADSSQEKNGKAESDSKEQSKKSGISDLNISSSPAKWASEYGNPHSDFVIQSDLIMPVIKATKDETAKPLVVFVDDDFETLDLIEIFLKRDYSIEVFSGPREAIFFLNQHVPEIVFIDCKIHTMKALTFMEIIRTGAGNENVPFVLVGSEEELAEFKDALLPKYVLGTMKRPVARGELQGYIDKVLKKDTEE